LFVEIAKRPPWVLRNMMLVMFCHQRDLVLKRDTEARQMPIALDPAEPGFNVEQRRRHPPLLLITAPPAIRLVGPLPELGHDRLQAVGGRQAPPLPFQRPMRDLAWSTHGPIQSLSALRSDAPHPDRFCTTNRSMTSRSISLLVKVWNA
jgi:hypothetical protein